MLPKNIGESWYLDGERRPQKTNSFIQPELTTASEVVGPKKVSKPLDIQQILSAIGSLRLQDESTPNGICDEKKNLPFFCSNMDVLFSNAGEPRVNEPVPSSDSKNWDLGPPANELDATPSLLQNYSADGVFTLPSTLVHRFNITKAPQQTASKESTTIDSERFESFVTKFLRNGNTVSTLTETEVTPGVDTDATLDSPVASWDCSNSGNDILDELTNLRPQLQNQQFDVSLSDLTLLSEILSSSEDSHDFLYNFNHSVAPSRNENVCNELCDPAAWLNFCNVSSQGGLKMSCESPFTGPCYRGSNSFDSSATVDSASTLLLSSGNEQRRAPIRSKEFFLKLVASEEMEASLNRCAVQLEAAKERTQTTVAFSPHGEYFPGSQDRVMMLASPTEKCLFDMIDFLIGSVMLGVRYDTSGRRKAKIKIAVPRAVIGSLIGKNGSYIQSVRMVTGAHVYISPLFVRAEEACSERLVTVSSRDCGTLRAATFAIVRKLNQHSANGSCRSVVYRKRCGHRKIGEEVMSSEVN